MKTRFLGPEEMQREIAELERRYRMTSAEFLLLYNQGRLDDRRDFVRWAGLLAMLDRSLKVQPTTGDAGL
jgi:hypothetical protein